MKHHNRRAVRGASEWASAFRRPHGVTNNKAETAAGTLAHESGWFRREKHSVCSHKSTFMSYRADGGAGICHKRGPILPGVNSSAVWLWGNSTAASSFRRRPYMDLPLSFLSPHCCDSNVCVLFLTYSFFGGRGFRERICHFFLRFNTMFITRSLLRHLWVQHVHRVFLAIRSRMF